jgi:hypothetical protein
MCVELWQYATTTGALLPVRYVYSLPQLVCYHVSAEKSTQNNKSRTGRAKNKLLSAAACELTSINSTISN